MGAVLESLLALQDIELQIVDIRRQLASKERIVKRQTAKLRAAEEAAAEAREDSQRTQMEMDNVGIEVRIRKEEVAKLRDTLNSVKTNKEYAAAMSQLNTEKADLTRLEQREYELLDIVEGKKKTLVEQQEQVQDEKRRLENLQSQLGQAQESFRTRLEQLDQQRTAAAGQLDAETLDLFNRISERYDGEVMAEVVRPHPRRQEFLCDGCNMSLAAERANALLSRDDVITCDNCGRILYIQKH
jgi:predicted  nucleic acid-binding Zn-ribbon protein